MPLACQELHTFTCCCCRRGHRDSVYIHVYHPTRERHTQHIYMMMMMIRILLPPFALFFIFWWFGGNIKIIKRNLHLNNHKNSNTMSPLLFKNLVLHTRQRSRQVMIMTNTTTTTTLTSIPRIAHRECLIQCYFRLPCKTIIKHDNHETEDEILLKVFVTKKEMQNC